MISRLILRLNFVCIWGSNTHMTGRVCDARTVRVLDGCLFIYPRKDSFASSESVISRKYSVSSYFSRTLLPGYFLWKKSSTNNTKSQGNESIEILRIIDRLHDLVIESINSSIDLRVLWLAVGCYHCESSPIRSLISFSSVSPESTISNIRSEPGQVFSSNSPIVPSNNRFYRTADTRHIFDSILATILKM
jgi:hypothetical protein